MATKVWAVRLAEFDIPVYEIQPGIIHSDMTAGVKAKYDKLIAEALTLRKRWGLPEDVGKGAAMLVRGELPTPLSPPSQKKGGDRGVAQPCRALTLARVNRILTDHWIAMVVSRLHSTSSHTFV